MHGNPQIELHEKTDIRGVISRYPELVSGQLSTQQSEPRHNHVTIDIPDVVMADVSFISLREILPSVANLCSKQTQIVMMVKPQFEAGESNLKHKGVIKNDKMRRDILKDFETWTQNSFQILDKADSDVTGAKGNRERFYLLRKIG